MAGTPAESHGNLPVVEEREKKRLEQAKGKQDRQGTTQFNDNPKPASHLPSSAHLAEEGNKKDR